MTSATMKRKSGASGRHPEGRGHRDGRLRVHPAARHRFFNIIYGIAAIANSHVFVANAHYVIGDLPAWVVTPILSVLQLVAAGGIVMGNQLARWFASPGRDQRHRDDVLSRPTRSGR